MGHSDRLTDYLINRQTDKRTDWQKDGQKKRDKRQVRGSCLRGPRVIGLSTQPWKKRAGHFMTNMKYMKAQNKTVTNYAVDRRSSLPSFENGIGATVSSRSRLTWKLGYLQCSSPIITRIIRLNTYERSKLTNRQRQVRKKNRQTQLHKFRIR